LVGLNEGRRYTILGEALREARLQIFQPGDALTWGAYQHYGSPAYRFFEPAAATPVRTQRTRKPEKPRRRRPGK
jgi:hypothetical protein